MKSASELTTILSHATETLAAIQGIDVGFFDRIPDATVVTLQELSGQMGYDIRMVERWLRFAVAAGYVAASDNGYTLTPKGALLRSGSLTPDLRGLYALVGYFVNVLPYSQDAYQKGIGFDSITKGAISKDFIPRVTSPLATTLVESFARLGLSDGQSVLDLGCGDGSMLRELVKNFPGVSATGIDINPHTIKLGRRINQENGLQDQIELRKGDVIDLDKINDNAFDWVCAVNVLHFLPVGLRENFLREMARISRWGILFTQTTADTLGACAANVLFSTLFADFTGFFTNDEVDALIRRLGIPYYASLTIFRGGSRLVVIPTSRDDALVSRIIRLKTAQQADPEGKSIPVLMGAAETISAPTGLLGEEARPDAATTHDTEPTLRVLDETTQRTQNGLKTLEEKNNNLELQISEKTQHLAKAYERLRISNQNLAIANRELEARNRNNHEIDRIKSDLISIVSHELRTPLTSIKAFAEMILMKPEMPAETRSNLVHIIDRESDRLTRLINDVLDLTKIESGKLCWRITQLSIGDIVETAVSSIRSLVENKGLTITAQVQQPLPFIFGDRDRLIQVLNNLLSNAIKFTPAGGSIEVDVRVEEAPKAHVVVSVTDTGMGIRNEEREQIFEKFHRSRDILESHPEGIGLGLTISRQIVEYHGGTIRVESKPGQGSRFIVALPLDKTWRQEDQKAEFRRDIGTLPGR